MAGMRLVATDLDGTVVRPDGTISPRTVAAFDACERAGVDVVFVTGRPPRWLDTVVEQTGHRGLVLCANGALVYDLAAERVVRSHTISRANVLEVRSRLRDAVPDATFALETLAGFRREERYLTRWDTGAESLVGPIEDMLVDDPGVLKLLCRNESGSSDELLDLARDLLDGIAKPTHSNPNDTLLEVSALGVSKARTVAELAEERGIEQADVVAFGDMPNDLELLAWAGRGYAMTGGHPDAIAAAPHLAPSCEDDGVAQVLERLLARISA
jgi:Cof subfamily protein (haloacid dehalogenase superfamily)